MLTKEQLDALKFPFKAAEHEFLKDKAYITESAITERIEQVDPSWSLEQVSLYTRSDSTAVCTMRLTIGGVWRDGVGMSAITKLKSGNGEANEAEKSAATDALKRAARLFGIGRYLLDLPSNVVNEATLRNYLIATYANTPDPTPQPTAVPQPVIGNPTPLIVDDEAELRRKAATALDNEYITIFKVRYEQTRGGVGVERWIATANVEGGGTVPITVYGEDAARITKAGYAWPKTDGDNLAIPVITTLKGSDRRITHVEPLEKASDAIADDKAAIIEAWLAQPVKDTWKHLHPYLLKEVYKGNSIGKDKSLAHHAKLTNNWAGMTAGDVIDYLNNRHGEELPKASGQ